MNGAAPRRMPAVFFGHGNPMNAVQSNPYTEAWKAIGAAIPRPRAIVAVSAHWYLPGTSVTAMEAPRTTHDCGGFPKELYPVQSPAPGDPVLAGRVQSLLAPAMVGHDDRWGLDHGTWSVLCHVYPAADVPVIQLSIDETQPPSQDVVKGRRLAPLRVRGGDVDRPARDALEVVERRGTVVAEQRAGTAGEHRPIQRPFTVSRRCPTA